MMVLEEVWSSHGCISAMLNILYYDSYHGKHQNEKQEEWQLWKKGAVDGFFPGNVLIT